MEQWHRLDPEPALKRLADFDGDLRQSIEKRFEMNKP